MDKYDAQAWIIMLWFAASLFAAFGLGKVYQIPALPATGAFALLWALIFTIIAWKKGAFK